MQRETEMRNCATSETQKRQTFSSLIPGILQTLYSLGIHAIFHIHITFYFCILVIISPQSSSVTQSCLTLCDPMNRSTPGLPVHNQLPESTQNHVDCVSDAIQPSHPLSSPSSPALNLSQHQGLFFASGGKVLELQLQHQSFQ